MPHFDQGTNLYTEIGLDRGNKKRERKKKDIVDKGRNIFILFGIVTQKKFPKMVIGAVLSGQSHIKQIASQPRFYRVSLAVLDDYILFLPSLSLADNDNGDI